MTKVSFYPREKLFINIVTEAMLARGYDLEWARSYATEAIIAGYGYEAAFGVKSDMPGFDIDYPELVVRNIDPPRPLEALRPWERNLVED